LPSLRPQSSKEVRREVVLVSEELRKICMMRYCTVPHTVHMYCSRMRYSASSIADVTMTLSTASGTRHQRSDKFYLRIFQAINVRVYK
jgi:hypothetical protein